MRQQEGQNYAVIALRRNTLGAISRFGCGSLFRDNTTQDVAMPVEVWSRGDRYEAVLDGEGTGHRRATLARRHRARLERDERRVGHACSGRRRRPSATTGGLSGEIGGRALP